MLSHLLTEDNLWQPRATVKCQEALVGMDVVSRPLVQVGIRAKVRVTASATATQAIKANYIILLAMSVQQLSEQNWWTMTRSSGAKNE